MNGGGLTFSALACGLELGDHFLVLSHFLLNIHEISAEFQPHQLLQEILGVHLQNGVVFQLEVNPLEHVAELVALGVGDGLFELLDLFLHGVGDDDPVVAELADGDFGPGKGEGGGGGPEPPAVGAAEEGEGEGVAEAWNVRFWEVPEDRFAPVTTVTSQNITKTSSSATILVIRQFNADLPHRGPNTPRITAATKPSFFAAPSKAPLSSSLS